MEQSPDFFLSCAGEYRPLREPRACWAKARLRNATRDDYMLIEIKPPLIGQAFGLAGKDIRQLIISTRLQGHTLYPITQWPLSVYVTRILDETILRTLSFKNNQVELIAWGMIFRTLEAALANISKMDDDVADKPLPSHHPQEMQVSDVQFLGEQDGPPERVLKNRLIKLFQRDKSVYRAYLTKASLEGQSSVVLCLKTQFAADRGLAEKIGGIFGMIFSAHEHLDIIFLSDRQESELTKVCSFFFQSSRG